MLATGWQSTESGESGNAKRERCRTVLHPGLVEALAAQRGRDRLRYAVGLLPAHGPVNRTARQRQRIRQPRSILCTNWERESHVQGQPRGQPAGSGHGGVRARPRVPEVQAGKAGGTRRPAGCVKVRNREPGEAVVAAKKPKLGERAPGG